MCVEWVSKHIMGPTKEEADPLTNFAAVLRLRTDGQSEILEAKTQRGPK